MAIGEGGSGCISLVGPYMALRSPQIVHRCQMTGAVDRVGWIVIRGVCWPRQSSTTPPGQIVTPSD